MTNKQDINAPIRVLLLGAESEVGAALLELSKAQGDIDWVCPQESLLLEHGAAQELAAIDYDVAIDALSLRYALQSDYGKFQATLTAVSEASAPLIMISSARVFSGDNNVPYLETDTPDSAEPYAQALIQSEQLVAKNEANIILRTGWLFSGKGDDFVCRTLGLIQDGVNLAYKDNLLGSPTPVSDLARVVLSLIKQRHYGASNTGVYHYCCAEEISWVGLVEAILVTSSQFDPKAQMEVESLEGAFSEEDGVVVQVKRQSLSCRKIFNHYGVKQRPWRSVLRNLVRELYKS
ncbi:sugar nucleotide-binding protein [Marinomonas pollencensis]|uniref:dTDP-4-dehydrorhamnose reductase n=1 Tax=Marinomonas pollencensis TaxID=491954 RepID=A0A3E0DTJ7_9GAMM|nr:sugar nucleotide-binding protein [Marinomonas pollencensis]REG84808.1 dTDP-4-dehydrorhamnose reductase [Marinomonas pollencensis]